MKPSELRELAEWHDERTNHINKIAELHWLTDNFRQKLLDELEKHAKSAKALRAFADVLEQKPVATCEKYDDGHFILAHDSGFWQPPIGEYQLIIKPIFGDDK